jgi:hypothetical protein
MNMQAKPTNHFSFSSATTRALTAALLFAGSSAHAHTFCVSNATQLQSALTDSSNGGMYNGEDNFVDVVQGTYATGAATGNAPFFYYSTSTHQLFINGGYTANCSSQSLKASLTILDGNGSTGVLTLRSGSGVILVATVTMQNGHSDEPGAGLQVNYLVTVNAPVNISDTIIRNNHSTVGAGGLYASGAGSSLYVSNNLISGNSAEGQDGAGYVTGYGQYTELYNNTVTQNTSTAFTNPSGGLYCAGTTPCQIYNNIFWNNTNYGIFLGNSGAVLSHNDYGTLGGETPASDISNLSVNPQFVDSANGNFHLAANSPLLGYGTPQGTITDLDGHPYSTSGGIDLGAYAETIFSDGFGP